MAKKKVMVDELDLPEGVAELLIKDGVKELYPPQAEAVFPALAGKNLMVAIPTASGKSLIAYLATLKQVLENHKKVIYIVPLRALAAEKYDDLRKFEKLGLRVGISVGDFDSPDPRFDKYDIIVATSEKADSLLRHKTDWVKNVALVVADEVHLLHDPGRGPTLEITLAKLKRLNPDIQIIALSATIQNAREVAEWLNAELIESEWRPTKLKEGVYFENKIYYVDNTRHEVRNLKTPVISLVCDAVENGGQCLVFVNTRKATETEAKKIAATLKYSPELEAEEGEESEQTSIAKLLKECMKRGVAFHHAGLTNDQRKYVEKNFKHGHIKCIVATPTLAAGINLPARRVIIRDVQRFGPGGQVAIPVMEVKQMCGRAGRPRFDPYGEAILLANSEEKKSFLIDNYILADSEEIYSKLGNESLLRSHILALIASETAHSRDTLMDFLNSTFYAHQTTVSLLEDTADKVLEFLAQEELIVISEEMIRATFFGKRVSDLYIDPLGAIKLRDALRNYQEGKTIFGFLQAICATPDLLPLYIKSGEDVTYDELVIRRTKELLLEPPNEFSEDYEFYLAEIKTAAMIESWIDEVDEETLLSQYGIGPGDLRNKADTAEWLIYATRELSNIFNKDAYPLLTELMARLKNGVKPELLELVKLRGVGRARARALYKYDLKNFEDLRNIDVYRLARIPGISKVLAERIKKQVDPEWSLANEKKEMIKEPPVVTPSSPHQKSLFDF
ncbi:DEAD/DEAH box helicase [Candidatus Methanomassiliicoccus intestinalis]|uniref:DEAD/DEAH box helicase n=1 Tax=Candidatus Methanomassiliicoccus intestinalis TaxID=1406512 RepID=UPI0037DD5AEC